MFHDEVLEEVRQAREAYGATFDFDLKQVVADLRRQNEQGDWPVVRRSPRRVALGLVKAGQQPVNSGK